MAKFAGKDLGLRTQNTTNLIGNWSRSISGQMEVFGLLRFSTPVLLPTGVIGHVCACSIPNKKFAPHSRYYWHCIRPLPICTMKGGRFKARRVLSSRQGPVYYIIYCSKAIMMPLTPFAAQSMNSWMGNFLFTMKATVRPTEGSTYNCKHKPTAMYTVWSSISRPRDDDGKAWSQAQASLVEADKIHALVWASGAASSSLPAMTVILHRSHTLWWWEERASGGGSSLSRDHSDRASAR